MFSPAEPARAGSWFTYDAGGLAPFELEADRVLVDWRSVPGGGEDHGPLRLPPGSRLGIALAEHPATALAFNGSLEPALQASFWAHHATKARSIDFLDAWISMFDANLVQSVSRRPLVVQDELHHSIDLGLQSVPPLLLASLVWGRTVTGVETGSVAFQDPSPLAGERRLLELTYRLEATRTDDAPRAGVPPTTESSTDLCHLWVSGWFDQQRGHDGPSFEVHLRAVFHPGIPLPVQFEEHTADEESLQLGLYAWAPGSGPDLPAFEPRPFHVGGLPGAPSIRGFLPGDAGFPTHYVDALEAMIADEQSGPWLRDHPDALPTRVVHAMGVPGGEIVDRWAVHWGSSDGSGQYIQVTNRSSMHGIPLLGGLTVVSSGHSEGRPTERATLPTQESLAVIHHQVYGKPPEVLRCDLVEGHCFLGTHAGTHHPFACDGACAATTIVPGVVVLLDQGLVPREQSFDSDALRAPVPMPAGWDATSPR